MLWVSLRSSVLRPLASLCLAFLASACNESGQYKAANPGQGAGLRKCSEPTMAGSSAQVRRREAVEAVGDEDENVDKKEKKDLESQSAKDDGVVEKITYENYIENFLKKRCLSCHGAGQEFPDLSSWKAVKGVKELLVEVVVKETMPPREYEQRLNVEMIRRVESWQKRRYPMADGPSAKATQQSSQGTVLGQGSLPQRTGSTGDEACDASSK